MVLFCLCSLLYKGNLFLHTLSFPAAVACSYESHDYTMTQGHIMVSLMDVAYTVHDDDGMYVNC